MKKRPIILIALIIILPLAALTWAAVRLAENEQVVVQQRYRGLMEDRLQDINANVSVVFDDIERSLQSVTAIDTFEPTVLRSVNRAEPRLLQLFVLTPEGQLAYPNPLEELNASERAFLIQAAQMFTGQDLKDAVARTEQQALGTKDKTGTGVTVPNSNQATSRQSVSRGSRNPSRRLPQFQRGAEPQAPAAGNASLETDVAQQVELSQELFQDVYGTNTIQNFEKFEATSGWFVWYWDRGLNLIYWQRRPSGHVVGCALERARWMADLIAQLPETVSGDSDQGRSVATRVRLVNSSAASVYQWGKFEPPTDSRPLCEVPLASPLASWRLQCFVPIAEMTAGTGHSAYIGLFAGLAAVGLASLLIAFLFVKEYSRDMQEASQQVSFVNQVSHELKTPLTNIRMYAELLDRDLGAIDDTDAEKPRERLDVILSEGQRLSRLISNVLTFARQKRKTLQLQPHDEAPGKLIHQIVDRFRPAFVEQNIDIQLDCDDETRLMIDADFLEQILGNLISNVEKYAASGGLLSIHSSIANNLLTIDVRDAGEGISEANRGDVFQPFARVSNDVSYAAGTGIGLSIARELAQLHGGDVQLLDASDGCWFQATMKGQS